MWFICCFDAKFITLFINLIHISDLEQKTWFISLSFTWIGREGRGWLLPKNVKICNFFLDLWHRPAGYNTQNVFAEQMGFIVYMSSYPQYTHCKNKRWKLKCPALDVIFLKKSNFKKNSDFWDKNSKIII